MEKTIIVALIGAIISTLTGIIVHYLNKRKDREQKELEFKLDKYSEFLYGFAEIGGSYKSYDAHLKISNSINTINLIGSIDVLKSTYSLLDYISTKKGADYSVIEQDKIVSRIILAIRKDLSQKYTGELKDFRFRTITPGLKPGEAIEINEESS